jgi:hypothetical protein
MIVVDTSVWINYFGSDPSRATLLIEADEVIDQIVVGDVILLEVLQGARDLRHARKLESRLRRFQIEGMLNPQLAIRAAEHYRTLRGLGVTVRKTADLIIATFCIDRGFTLLHEDRDFTPMAIHLGLQVL